MSPSTDEDQVRETAKQLRRLLDSMPKPELPPAMREFPRGSCGDTSLLLGALLADRGFRGFDCVSAERGLIVDGTWTSHAWLVSESLIVDITADQFPDAPAAIIVARKSSWHAQFTITHTTHGDFRASCAPTNGELQVLYSKLKHMLDHGPEGASAKDAIRDRAEWRMQWYHGHHDHRVISRVVRSLPSISGGHALVRRLDRARSDAEFEDLLAEAWFAAVFRFCGYSVTFYPDGASGPDLLITKSDSSIYVEVARFRPMNAGPSESADDADSEALPEYGNYSRDSVKVRKKIYSKFAQIGMRTAAIAIWNDDEALEDLEFHAAVVRLRGDAAIPAGLEVAIYGSKWVNCDVSAGGAGQFVSIPFRERLSPWAQALTHAIGRVNLSSAVADLVAHAP